MAQAKPSKKTTAKAARPARKAAAKTPRRAPAGKAKPKAARAATAGAPQVEAEVLVVGDHPSASLCALMLREAKVEVALLDTGQTPNAERLVTINPKWFDLHKSLESLRPELGLAPIGYAQFLGPEGELARSQARSARGKGSDALAYVASMREVRDAVRTLATDAGVPILSGALDVEGVDETGVSLSAAGRSMKPRVLAIGDPLPDETAALLGAPRFPGREASMQATARLDGASVFGPAADEQGIAVTLDLAGKLQWGWMLRRGDEAELCVQCPVGCDRRKALAEWLELLRRHEIIAGDVELEAGSIQAFDLPLAGALVRDVVARRTLLMGPAGGFYSASGEDVYPGCWSAKFAADVAAKAVRAEHPQDALGAYRGKWGSTLGEYLRGPQQNLRFLLPLVYKNPVMTDRLASAIFLGESLVK